MLATGLVLAPAAMMGMSLMTPSSTYKEDAPKSRCHRLVMLVVLVVVSNRSKVSKPTEDEGNLPRAQGRP
jgi:hypothetical protein